LLTEEAAASIREYYLRMRAMSGSTESPVPITPRQLEALVRLSEARARAFLRDRILVEDTQAIIRLFTLSMQEVGIDTETGKMDIDIIMTGKSRNQNDRMQIILGTVRDLEKKADVVEENELIKILSTKVEVSEPEARALIQQMLKEGLLYQPKPGHVKRTTV